MFHRVKVVRTNEGAKWFSDWISNKADLFSCAISLEQTGWILQAKMASVKIKYGWTTGFYKLSLPVPGRCDTIVLYLLRIGEWRADLYFDSRISRFDDVEFSRVDWEAGRDFRSMKMAENVSSAVRKKNHCPLWGLCQVCNRSSGDGKVPAADGRCWRTLNVSLNGRDREWSSWDGRENRSRGSSLELECRLSESGQDRGRWKRGEGGDATERRKTRWVTVCVWQVEVSPKKILNEEWTLSVRKQPRAGGMKWSVLKRTRSMRKHAESVTWCCAKREERAH